MIAKPYWKIHVKTDDGRDIYFLFTQDSVMNAFCAELMKAGNLVSIIREWVK